MRISASLATDLDADSVLAQLVAGVDGAEPGSVEFLFGEKHAGARDASQLFLSDCVVMCMRV